jgi:hypothetical protein
MDDTEVVNFLLQTEIIPLCLRIMESGSELSKTVATFIVQKILLDDVGLSYICATAERFFAVSTVLANMVNALVETPSHRCVGGEADRQAAGARLRSAITASELLPSNFDVSLCATLPPSSCTPTFYPRLCPRAVSSTGGGAAC